jgi:Protein of unknown function (DUF2511)
VSRADFGDDWPLTVESGLLCCRAGAVNGQAMGNKENLDVGPIWASGENAPKKNIGPLIQAGLALCD